MIYGRPGVSGLLDLSIIGANDGFVIQGAAEDDRLGEAVAMAGDVNGDGFHDVIVGAPRNDDGADNAGSAYLIFGPKPEAAVERVGSDADQPILGGDFNDTVSGEGGDDTLTDLSGNDTLNGGLGADVMDGGLGNDRFFVDDANDVVIEAAGEGKDLISTSVDFTLADNVENGSTLGTGDVAITGNALANFITGNGGANHLRGEGGADRLITGLGDDTLEGGEGNDILQGQGGSDRFVMGASNGNDQILGWEATTDVLDFGALGLRFAELRITSSGNEASPCCTGHRFRRGSAPYYPEGSAPCRINSTLIGDASFPRRSMR